MRITGLVLDGASCSPMPGVRVQVWHEGPSGGYKDRFRSVVVTDERGKFRYEGPVLKASDEAEPHAHFLVEVPWGQFPFTAGVPVDERPQVVRVTIVLPPEDAPLPAV